MLTSGKIHNWMVQNLEAPFYQAELHRVEMVRADNHRGSGKPKLIVLSLLALIPAALLITLNL